MPPSSSDTQRLIHGLLNPCTAHQPTRQGVELSGDTTKSHKPTEAADTLLTIFTRGCLQLLVRAGSTLAFNILDTRDVVARQDTESGQVDRDRDDSDNTSNCIYCMWQAGLILMARLAEAAATWLSARISSPFPKKNTTHHYINTTTYQNKCTAQPWCRTSPSLISASKCATERKFLQHNAEKIALHLTHLKWVYRFAPGSTITVSIDKDDFMSRGCLSNAQYNSLHDNLRGIISTLNALHFGIQFQYIEAGIDGRGLIQLQYGGDATETLPDGSTITTWASSQFPERGVTAYTVYVYAATFESRYLPAIVSILSHEFAHLLGMRHYPAPASEPSWAPYGDMDEQSIMGGFNHPGDLFFHPLDVFWLTKLYAMKEGERIPGGMEIADVKVPVALLRGGRRGISTEERR